MQHKTCHNNPEHDCNFKMWNSYLFNNSCYFTISLQLIPDRKINNKNKAKSNKRKKKEKKETDLQTCRRCHRRWKRNNKKSSRCQFLLTSLSTKLNFNFPNTFYKYILYQQSKTAYRNVLISSWKCSKCVSKKEACENWGISLTVFFFVFSFFL